MTMFNDAQARSGRLSAGKVASDFVTDHFHLPWADREAGAEVAQTVSRQTHERRIALGRRPCSCTTVH